MASISTGKTGLRRIVFSEVNGKRKIVYLGKTTKKAAEKIKIEALVTALIAGVSVDSEIAEWLGSRDDVLYGKLTAAGFAPERAKPDAALLDKFIDAYISSRTDVKPNTKDHLLRTKRDLVKFYGAGKPLNEITPGSADEFRRHLATKMADNTVRRICGRAKQFFRAAVRKRLIAACPFGDMKDTCVRANKSREFFITREIAAKVLDACPDSQWRLLFAPSRFGGLRCPSEHVALRWGDIDWENNRFTVHSPKTEHHEGHESRLVPIFPVLRSYLEAAFDDAAEGTEFVITRYRDANANLRTQFERILRKAGLEPWQKPFQNLRSTRETELAETFPIHVVCAWIGNSESVAKKHYLQVTDEHFSHAANLVQNPTHNAAKPGNMGPHGGAKKWHIPRELRESAANPEASSSPEGTLLETRRASWRARIPTIEPDPVPGVRSRHEFSQLMGRYAC